MKNETGTGKSEAVTVREHVQRVHHIGIPVRNLERSIEWYGELFGLSPEFIAISEGPETDETVQLEDVRLRFAFLPLGETYIELLEYEQPVGRAFDRRNCDVGAIHICLEVDDIDHVHRFLRSRAVEFNNAPTTLTMAPVAGHQVCYFRDPDGIQLELWQRPKALEELTDAKESRRVP